MLLPILSIIAGLALLVWSAERFIAGASSTARFLGMPPLLIGMLVVGFGTSAPEVFVSVLSASQGNPAVALGNAYGSNITNIALILGLTAIIHPIAFNSKVLRMELRLYQAIYPEAWGPVRQSRGFFPSEMAFAEHIMVSFDSLRHPQA